MRDRPLTGKNIVVTRPARQARELAEMIRAAGGAATLFPVLEIRDVEDLKPLRDIIARLDEFDLAIFISPNAVNKAMNLITAHGTLPPALICAAIGRGGVKELARFGVTNAIAPSPRFDSEALLELPELQEMRGKRVVIFRGDGGRELLGDTLKLRGATVEYAECYRRGMPNLDAAPLLKAWARNELDAITVTSSEGLRNLYEMIGVLGRQWLRKTAVFVPHPRIAEVAHELGLTRVIVTAPADEGLLSALIEHFATASPRGKRSG
ncbi:MAG: uroporphyrinogen-III synthase [Betaproteobacteria bacterium]|nr:MAG: uroporphyrinogen-III synthase [Betaproteobacteria bacterium]